MSRSRQVQYSERSDLLYATGDGWCARVLAGTLRNARISREGATLVKPAREDAGAPSDTRGLEVASLAVPYRQAPLSPPVFLSNIGWARNKGVEDAKEVRSG